MNKHFKYLFADLFDCSAADIGNNGHMCVKLRTDPKAGTESIVGSLMSINFIAFLPAQKPPQSHSFSTLSIQATA